jgi:hypothetical protein
MERVTPVVVGQPTTKRGRPSGAHTSWIDASIALWESGKTTESLDVIFDFIDDLLLASKFEECDSALAKLPVGRLSNAQMVTLLTATAPAKDRLPARSTLFANCKNEIHARGADAENLLVGLD